MSKPTFRKLPRHVQKMLLVYGEACKKGTGMHPRQFEVHINRSSDAYRAFARHKLAGQGTRFHKDDFPALVARSLEPVFGTLLITDPLDSVSVDDLFVSSSDETISGSAGLTWQKTSDFQSSMMTSLASSQKPIRWIPRYEHGQRQVQWFLKLVRNTPVVIFLRQRHRLFSQASLYRLNMPLLDLKEGVRRLAAKHGLDGGLRTYHLTELTRVDLLEVAIKAGRLINDGSPIGAQIENLAGTPVLLRPDLLCQNLHRNRNVATVRLGDRKEMEDVTKIEKTSLTRIRNALQNGHAVTDVFPYDLDYCTYHMVTIEDDVLAANHEALFGLLASSDLEVMAASLRLDNQVMGDFMEQRLSTTQIKDMDYDAMLKYAKTHGKRPGVTPSNSDTIADHLGRLGLTQVKRGWSDLAVYLFPVAWN